MMAVDRSAETHQNLDQGAWQLISGRHQIVKLEPAVAGVFGGGTSAVLLRGGSQAVPEGAILVTPDSVSSGTTCDASASLSTGG